MQVDSSLYLVFIHLGLDRNKLLWFALVVNDFVGNFGNCKPVVDEVFSKRVVLCAYKEP